MFHHPQPALISVDCTVCYFGECKYINPSLTFIFFHYNFCNFYNILVYKYDNQRINFVP